MTAPDLLTAQTLAEVRGPWDSADAEALTGANPYGSATPVAYRNGPPVPSREAVLRSLRRSISAEVNGLRRMGR